jgi:hypothetical protein
LLHSKTGRVAKYARAIGEDFLLANTLNCSGSVESITRWDTDTEPEVLRNIVEA